MKTTKSNLIIKLIIVIIVILPYIVFLSKAEEVGASLPNVYYLNDETNTVGVTVEDYQSMVQATEEKWNKNVGNDGNGNIPIKEWKRTKQQVLQQFSNASFEWMWEEVTAGEENEEAYWYGEDDIHKIWDGSRLKVNSDGTYQVNRNYAGYLTNNKITAMYDNSSKVLYDSATWEFGIAQTGMPEYKLERFQGEFTVKEDPKTHDYTLSTVTCDDRFYINDELFVFVYPKDMEITNDNFMDYFIFWGGTGNEDYKFHGREYLDASITNPNENYFVILAHQYYLPVVNDNIGDVIEDNWSEDKENVFIIDVFTADRSGGGGMYRPVITSTSNESTSAEVTMKVVSTTGVNVEGARYMMSERIWDEEGVSDVNGNLKIKVHPSEEYKQTLEAVELPGYVNTNAKWEVKVNSDGSYEINGVVYNANNPFTIQLTPIIYTLNLEGESALPSGVSSSISYTIEDIVNLPSLSKIDNIFNGWEVTMSDGNWKIGELYKGQINKMYGNVTLTEQWTNIGIAKEGVITFGKVYDDVLTESNTAIVIEDEFITAQFVVESCNPNIFYNRTLEFTEVLPVGTKITMIDKTIDNNIGYYYLNLENSTQTIKLTEFQKMGGTANYIETTNFPTEITEKFLFIIDFSNVITVPVDNTITLTRGVEGTTFTEQRVSYTVTEKVSLTLSLVNSPQSISDDMEFSYSHNATSFDNSKLNECEIAIVISSADELPAETRLYDGTNYYSLNSNGQFIVPVGDINESKNIVLKLVSESLLTFEQGCNLKAELWVAENNEKPFMGDKVATVENIILEAKKLPSIKMEMDTRWFNLSEFNGEINIQYESQNIAEYGVTLGLQKKSESGEYVTQTETIESVEGITTNNNGEFTLNIVESGNLIIKLNNNALSEGTYRILIKVKEENEIKLTIPYNFIILE